VEIPSQEFDLQRKPYFTESSTYNTFLENKFTANWGEKSQDFTQITSRRRFSAFEKMPYFSEIP
jgi:hypothetical protein